MPKRLSSLVLPTLILVYVVCVLVPISHSQGSNYSVLLNGTSSYVDVPYNANLNITGALTMEAWVKTSSTSYQQVLERGDWFNNQMSYDLQLGEGKARMDIMQSNGSYAACIGSTVLSTGVWHHIAGVYDGSQMRLYLDGVLDASATATMAPGNNSYRLTNRKELVSVLPLLLQRTHRRSTDIECGNLYKQLHPERSSHRYFKH